MTKALFIVDVQNDFTERGALGVDGGDEVAARITRFLAAHAGDYEIVVASRDWHDGDNDNGGHFASGEPDFIDTWPPHCVAGTYGAEYDEGLRHVRGDPPPQEGSGQARLLAVRGRRRRRHHGVRSCSSGTASSTSTSWASPPTTACAPRPSTRSSTAATCGSSPTWSPGVHPASSEKALAEIAHAGAELVESGA